MPALTGSRPWSVEHVVLASATDWNVYTAPSWVRRIMIRNEHGSGVLYVGRYDETGAFSAANDEYITLAAGASVEIPITAGLGTTDSAHYAIPLASATASLPVGLLFVESAQ
jgi:hypothetical protein